MRHLGVVVATGALLVLAAGCARPGQTAAGAGASTTVPVQTTTGRVATGPGPAMPGAHLPAGVVPVAGKQVDARSLPASFPREVWTDKAGTLLGFYGQQGGCSTQSASVTEQNAQQVTVRFVQQEPGTAATPCPMYLAYKPMSVTLAAPLGDRTVVLQLSIVRG